MEENKLIKFENGALQKVGNAIDITNKLLQNNFDYLKWWNNLGKEWQEIFILQLREMSLFLAWDIEKGKEYNQIELVVSKFNDNYIEGDFDLEIEKIKYLISAKEISILKKGINNLEPLKLFNDLEKLEILDVKINSLKPLYELKKLKLFDCSKSHINIEEIEKFKNDHPNCEVIV